MIQQINALNIHEDRNIWEIEMTGGPISESEPALDYTYTNLVEDYWPALLGAVQYYTGKITMDYVGHSNGCRVALSSLKNYQTTGKSNVAIVQNLITGNYQTVSLQGAGGAHIVNTFVGVACPTTLNDESIFSTASRYNIIPLIGPHAGNAAMALITDDHVTLQDYATRLILATAISGNPTPAPATAITYIVSIFVEDNKISRNLMDFYNDLSIEENSNFDLTGLNVSKVRLYYGRLPLRQDDSIVPVDDMNIILNNITSSDKLGEIRTGLLSDHSHIKTREDIKNNIIGALR